MEALPFQICIRNSNNSTLSYLLFNICIYQPLQSSMYKFFLNLCTLLISWKMLIHTTRLSIKEKSALLLGLLVKKVASPKFLVHQTIFFFFCIPTVWWKLKLFFFAKKKSSLNRNVNENFLISCLNFFQLSALCIRRCFRFWHLTPKAL